MRRCLVFALTLFSAHCLAEGCADQRPLQKMLCEAAMANFEILTATISKDSDALRKAANHGKDALDENIDGAVKSLKGKTDAQRALKEYYAAAGMYYAHPTGILGKRYEDDAEAKAKTLELELRLAGVR